MISLICFILSALLLFLLGFHVVEQSSKYNLDEIATGLIALGLAFRGVVLPALVVRKED